MFVRSVWNLIRQIAQEETRPGPETGHARPAPAPIKPRPFTVVPDQAAQPVHALLAPDRAKRQRQLLSLTLEKLHDAVRRASARDAEAAAADLRRVALEAGLRPSVLLNVAGPDGGTLIQELARSQIDVQPKFDMLLRLGLDLAALDASGQSALHSAARLGNVELIDALARKAPQLLNRPSAQAQGYVRCTPLAIALVADQAGAAEHLIASGARPLQPCCHDDDDAPLNAHQLYSRLGHSTVEVVDALAKPRHRRPA